jgi:hypothetical protein
MRKVWNLPEDRDLQIEPYHWFQAVISKLPSNMIDATLLVAWRIWFARNEATHDKPLPSCDSSRRFLSG